MIRLVLQIATISEEELTLAIRGEPVNLAGIETSGEAELASPDITH